jgi:hypothetical protein
MVFLAVSFLQVFQPELLAFFHVWYMPCPYSQVGHFNIW